jgi:hypothetical protein
MANPPVEFAAPARSLYFAPQLPKQSCHPERSEGSAFLSHRGRAAQNFWSAAACRRLRKRSLLHVSRVNTGRSKCLPSRPK